MEHNIAYYRFTRNVTFYTFELIVMDRNDCINARGNLIIVNTCSKAVFDLS